MNSKRLIIDCNCPDHIENYYFNEILRIKEQERLNAVKEEQRLNELKRQEEQKRLDELKKQEESQKLNENVNFKDIDVVTLDMFNKARYNSMMQIANKTIPK